MTHNAHDQFPSRTLGEASRASRRRLFTLLGAVPLTIGFTPFTAPEVTAKKRRKHK